MSIAKVIEVIAEGDTLQGAIESAAKEASKTLKNVRSVYVEGIQGLVENGRVTSFRVNAKVTFVIE
jgi:dodecin